MLYVCVRDVMDVVFSVCIVRRGVLGASISNGECFVMQMLYVCVLCVSSGRSDCCVLNDLHFVNAESRLLLTPSCCGECFKICRDLCACTEMVWMCVRYGSLGRR